jgi:hypothetical protein
MVIDHATPRSRRAARPGALGPPCASQPRKLRRGGDEGGSAMSRVFSRSDEEYEAVAGLTPPQGYVDVLGEPIDPGPALFDNRIVISGSEVCMSRVLVSRCFVLRTARHGCALH